MCKIDLEHAMSLAVHHADLNAARGFENGGPFGAVIVHKATGNVIAGAHNTVLQHADPTAHAEVNAIRTACKVLNTHDLTDYALVTSCYPCPMCLSATVWANIDTIYYGNTQYDAASIGFRDDHIYNLIKQLKQDGSDEVVEGVTIKQVHHDISISTFNEFANTEDKTIY